MPQKVILIVDDEPNNIRVLREILSPEGYRLFFAKTGQSALNMISKNKPDLILLDIMMPGMDGYELCSRILNNPSSENIPVIFVSTMNEVGDEAKGFSAGAVDYITKPVSAPIVIARVKTHLSLVQNRVLEQAHKEAISMLAAAGHYNDTDTGVHIWRMADYAAAIAEQAGWHSTDLYNLKLAASMHDTGKIGTPDGILKAPRKLSPEERVIMQAHAQTGFYILSKVKSDLFQMAAEIALNHHEKWDGSGYPAGRVGNDIPESALIVAIADVFDALTMKRPYKAAWSNDDAITEIKLGSGQHFSPQLVDSFESILPTIEAIQSRWNESANVEDQH